MKNQGQTMISLQSIWDIIAAIQTHVRSIDIKLTTVINEVARHNAMELNRQRQLFRLPKISFPKFAGRNPRAWTNRCEQFFELCPIPEHQKVLYASFHLEGSPKIWFRSYYEPRNSVLHWGTFVHAIVERYRWRPDDPRYGLRLLLL